MVFQPDTNQELIIGGVRCHIAEHPFAPGMPYGQEGRTAVVYQLAGEEGYRAFKVFKPRYRVPALVSLSRRLAPFANLPGLQVCRRSVLTPQQEGDVLSEHPDLIYAVVMPWIEGPSWMEVLLNNQKVTPEESLIIARAFAGVLAGMEQEGLAHCDLSGPNLLIPLLAEGEKRTTGNSKQTAIELVDVEQMYGPDLRKPDFLPSGSSGYAHNTSHEGMWSPDADRFAGALLLAEILGWCDERIRNMAWGESYFAPKEMQQANDRYHALIAVLKERWGNSIAGLFEQSWLSSSSVECPTFGEWMMKLPQTPPAYVASTLTLPVVATKPNTHDTTAPVTQSEATETIPTAPSPVPPAPTLIASGAPVEHLFDDGLAAYRRGDWASASELLAAVIYQDPGYTKDGENAAFLLVEADGHLASQPATPPVPSVPQPQVIPYQVPQQQVSSQQTIPQQVVPQQETPKYVAPQQVAPQPTAYESSPTDAYYAPQSATVNAPRPRRVNVIIPALIVLALLLAGGIVWYLTQSSSQAQEVAAAATATAVAERDAAATAAVEDVTSTAVAINAASTAAAAEETAAADQTSTAVSDNATQVAVFAQQTSEVIAADTTRTAQANAAITVQAQVVATKEALVVETSVAAQATAKAIPLSANAISVSNRDRVTTLRTLNGHTDQVFGIAFSLDGQLIASASGDHTARVWRVSDSSLVQTMQHEGSVYGVAFSPDSKTLATASDDGTKLWNVADGLLLRDFGKGTSFAVAFSADGLTVVSGAYDGTVTVWRVVDGSPLRTLTGHTGYILNINFSPDQTIIAAGADDSTIRLWQATDGAPIRTLIGTNRITGMAFSPDGQMIISSSGDDSLKVWRVSDGALLGTIASVPSIGVTFSPDGQLFVAAGSWVKNIRVWRVSDGAEVGKLEGHTAAVNGVVFSPDGAILASSADDNTIRLWGVP